MFACFFDLAQKSEPAEEGYEKRYREIHDRSVENGYRAFLESLDGALSSAVQEMGAYEGTDNLADAAVHFGLLSYAAGLVSRQYVAQLRARTKPAGKPDKAEAKKAAKSRKERKD